MCQTAWRPMAWVLIVALLVAPVATAGPLDDPKSKAPASKSKKTAKSKDKTGDEKPKTPDESKVEEKAKRRDAAFKAAEAFLVLLDKEKYGESWETMTADFRKGITRRKWVDALGKTRGAVGPLQGRKLKKIDLRDTEVADRWDEAWVYTDFRTSDGSTGSELIIVNLINGKDWMVNSYYIGDPATFPKPPALEENGPKPAAK